MAFRIQGVGQAEHIDQPRAAWRLAGKRKTALVAQHVDGRGFTGVRAADKADLGGAGGRQLVEASRGSEEGGAM
ncbi:hypothetical protein D9M69_611130 [compost metagenome]